ncbi:unnamed protein product [Amoebophrya sp. A120]|nr:unnamed protein product [Amoebophrya sp. A120]|eukprot:GSA120T00020703001.1
MLYLSFVVFPCVFVYLSLHTGGRRFFYGVLRNRESKPARAGGVAQLSGSSTSWFGKNGRKPGDQYGESTHNDARKQRTTSSAGLYRSISRRSSHSIDATGGATAAAAGASGGNHQGSLSPTTSSGGKNSYDVLAGGGTATQPGSARPAELPVSTIDEKYAGRLTLMPVVDANFAGKNFIQLYSIQCYARKHGYKFELLNLNSQRFADCNAAYPNDFFFRKHCAVAQVLKARQTGGGSNSRAGASGVVRNGNSDHGGDKDSRRRLNSAVPAAGPGPEYYFVVDSDMAVAGLEQSLAPWLDGNPADLTFYERSWNFEVMAGNYIVKNTPFATQFLENWAKFYHRRPPGFSSSDQGAIHQLLAEALWLKGRQKCDDMYKHLTASVMDLKPYFRFVSCVKQLLGPPRDWETKIKLTRKTHAGAQQKMGSSSAATADEDAADGGTTSKTKWLSGGIRILPRWHGFAADGVFSGTRCSMFHVFHHGVKGSKEAGNNYPHIKFAIGSKHLLNLLSAAFYNGLEQKPYDFLQTSYDDNICTFDSKKCGNWNPVGNRLNPPWFITDRRKSSEMLLAGEGWLWGTKTGDHGVVARWPIRDCLINYQCKPLKPGDKIKNVPYAGPVAVTESLSSMYPTGVPEQEVPA